MMLNVKISSTVNGIASITVGSIDMRATHQACSKNARHAKGLRGMSTNVSNAMARKPPSARSGLKDACVEVINSSRSRRLPIASSLLPGVRTGRLQRLLARAIQQISARLHPLVACPLRCPRPAATGTLLAGARPGSAHSMVPARRFLKPGKQNGFVDVTTDRGFFRLVDLIEPKRGDQPIEGESALPP